MKITIPLVPFSTPNYVTMQMPDRPRQEGFVEAPKYALSELEPEVLSGLCDEFRAAVFKKAGKRDPKL